MEDLPDQDLSKDTQGAEEISENEGNGRPPAFVMNFYSWWIPIVGVVMLLVGLVAGYFLRPLVPTSLVAKPTPTLGEVASVQTQAPQPTMDPATRKQLMDYLLPNVKHFTGDEKAPITLLEFSDFQ